MNRRRILIVDDDEDLLEIMRDCLRDANYRVATLDRSHNVPAAVIAHQPDLIIMDVLMHPYDGPQVIEQLSTAGLLTPMIVVTGLSVDGDSLAGHRLVKKPFEIKEFLQAVVDIIGTSPRATEK